MAFIADQMTPLIGSLRLARSFATPDADRNGKLQQVLAIADEGVQQLRKLIESLVNLSRAQRGHLEIGRSLLDMSLRARRVAGELELPSWHTLALDISDEPVPVVGDGVRLSVVLNNLLQNAIRYSPAGGVITLQVARNEQHALLSVADDGIGIAARDHLFQRFYRAANAVQAHTTGFGIGLYLVKQILSLHDGELEIQSAEGQGTSVIVRLPLACLPSEDVDAEFDLALDESPHED